MIELQVLNYILTTKDFSILLNNNFDARHFYHYKKQYNYIKNHFNKYQNVPDKETFIKAFEDFNFIDVYETKDFLIQSLQNSYLYNESMGVIKKAAELFTNTSSEEAISYMYTHMESLLKKSTKKVAELISESDLRYEKYLDVMQNKDKYFIPTGFKEIDEVTGGIDSKNDVVVFAARPGEGKTWVSNMVAFNGTKLGKNILYFAGEMNEYSIGGRVDTIYSNISNFSITRGNPNIKDDYKKALEEMKRLKGKFYVVTPKMLGGGATVSKLKLYCMMYDIDMLFIDQISLMEDEKNGYNIKEKTGNLSLDIKTLQSTLEIPVILVSQLNRDAVKEETKGVEVLSNNDRIGQDASIVFYISRKGPNLVLEMVKARGTEGNQKFIYNWNVDKGLLTYVPTNDDAFKGERCEEVKDKYQDKREPF